jgi:4'-phosphopantetheinyl transferase
VSACVNVWLARADVAVADDELDDHERGRALRFRHADLRRRFVAAHVTLRRLLSLHGAGRPAALHWPVAAGGKPGPVTLASGGLLHHNLSHAGEWIAVCISPDCAVGVDVEVLRPLEDMDVLAELALPLDARKRWTALPQVQRLPAFYLEWTQREAWLKADGRGIATRHPVVHGGSPDDRRARLLVRLGHVVLACIAMCSEARSSSTSTTCIAPPMPWESRNVGGERVTQRLAQA